MQRSSSFFEIVIAEVSRINQAPEEAVSPPDLDGLKVSQQ